jgi:hypothetical protein
LLGELEELGLVEQSRRAGLLTLRTGQLEKLRRYLAVRWPQVSEAEEVFNSQPHNISATALRTLRRSPLTLPKGIVRLNRKTWSAWAGAHSKSGLATPPDGLVLTTDEGLRLRANAGLQIVDEEGASLDFDQWQSVLGEITIPQRAFARRWFISGVMPKLV